MSGDQQKKATGRRKLLRSVVAGGGVLAAGRLLPDNWARPVVQSVILPAHGQTSPVSFDGLYVAVNGDIADAASSQPGSILDMFISPARAASFYCNAVTRVQISVSGDQAQVCLSTSDDAQSADTNVDPDTGVLDDVSEVGDSTIGLANMMVSADASNVSGNFTSTRSDPSCDGLSFTAARTDGESSCAPIATSSSSYISSPFKGKA